MRGIFHEEGWGVGKERDEGERGGDREGDRVGGKVAKDSFSGEVTFEQRPERGEQASPKPLAIEAQESECLQHSGPAGGCWGTRSERCHVGPGGLQFYSNVSVKTWGDSCVLLNDRLQ